MGDIIRGTSSLSGLYRGNTEIQKVYRGTQEIWTSGFNYPQAVAGFKNDPGGVLNSIGPNYMEYKGERAFLIWELGSNPAGKDAPVNLYFQVDSDAITSRAEIFVEPFADNTAEGFDQFNPTDFDSGLRHQFFQIDTSSAKCWHYNGTQKVYDASLADGIAWDKFKGTYFTIPNSWVNQSTGYGRLAVRILSTSSYFSLNNIYIGWEDPSA